MKNKMYTNAPRKAMMGGTQMSAPKQKKDMNPQLTMAAQGSMMYGGMSKKKK